MMHGQQNFKYLLSVNGNELTFVLI